MGVKILIFGLILLKESSLRAVEGTSINHTGCFSNKVNTEIITDNQYLQTFRLQRFDKISFKAVFEECTNLKYFLACSQKSYLSFGFFPMNQIQKYIELPTQFLNYTLITDMYKANESIIYQVDHQFFYNSMHIQKYEQR